MFAKNFDNAAQVGRGIFDKYVVRREPFSKNTVKELSALNLALAGCGMSAYGMAGSGKALAKMLKEEQVASRLKNLCQTHALDNRGRVDLDALADTFRPNGVNTSGGGQTSGKGSKYYEVFDLADNYKLSDDTFNNHILDRHGSNSAYGNKSHFNVDFDIRDGIDSTLRGDNFTVGPNTAGRDGYIFEQTFSNPIGTDSKGKPLYVLKVVIDEFGNVVTAFPKKVVSSNL